MLVNLETVDVGTIIYGLGEDDRLNPVVDAMVVGWDEERNCRILISLRQRAKTEDFKSVTVVSTLSYEQFSTFQLGCHWFLILDCDFENIERDVTEEDIEFTQCPLYSTAAKAAEWGLRYCAAHQREWFETKRLVDVLQEKGSAKKPANRKGAKARS